MHCGIGFIQWLSESGYVPLHGRVVVVGAARMLGARTEEIRELLLRHGTNLTGKELENRCELLSKTSGPDQPPFPFGLILNDLFHTTRVQCQSYDPALWLPRSFRGQADLVLNFGATAVAWDQAAVFQQIHDACKPGGNMFHQLPATGYLGQGYFCYQPNLFADLAQQNDYDIVALWYSGPLSAASVLSLGEQWPGVLDSAKPCNDIEGFRTYPVPDSVLNVLLRKRTSARFCPPVPVPKKPNLLLRAAHRLIRTFPRTS